MLASSTFPFLLLLVATIEHGAAFSTGAGCCDAGTGFPEGTFHANHDQSGSLEDEGYDIMMDGSAPVDSVFSVCAGDEASIALSTTTSEFRGFRVRIEAATTGPTENVFALAKDVTNARFMETGDMTCKLPFAECPEGVSAITHTDNGDKTEVSGISITIPTVGTYPVDVTVVKSASVWFHTSYSLDVTDCASDASTTAAPETTTVPDVETTTWPVSETNTTTEDKIGARFLNETAAPTSFASLAPRAAPLNGTRFRALSETNVTAAPTSYESLAPRAAPMNSTWGGRYRELLSDTNSTAAPTGTELESLAPRAAPYNNTNTAAPTSFESLAPRAAPTNSTWGGRYRELLSDTNSTAAPTGTGFESLAPRAAPYNSTDTASPTGSEIAPRASPLDNSTAAPTGGRRALRRASWRERY